MRMLHLLTSVALVALLSATCVAADAVRLFDGKSLSGWDVPDGKGQEGHWKVVEGALVAENPNKVGSVLWTSKKYHDYEIELEYRTPSEYYDSGVMLRGDGHQVQIGISGSL
ncbi:MAG: DUF1080 domain-containing protein, partial [Planctomycetales bacterium]|nr:DUF1080 domain-containing protein [Planctomycetales bacterium]